MWRAAAISRAGAVMSVSDPSSRLGKPTTIAPTPDLIERVVQLAEHRDHAIGRHPGGVARRQHAPRPRDDRRRVGHRKADAFLADVHAQVAHGDKGTRFCGSRFPVPGSGFGFRVDQMSEGQSHSVNGDRPLGAEEPGTMNPEPEPGTWNQEP